MFTQPPQGCSTQNLVHTAVRFWSTLVILNQATERQAEFLIGCQIPSTLFSWNSSVKTKLHQIAKGVGLGRHSSEQSLKETGSRTSQALGQSSEQQINPQLCNLHSGPILGE